MTDYFGRDATPLKSKTLFLLDMDDTIYNEDTLFPGTLPLLSRIEENGGRYVFITNNSSRSVEAYVEKVTAMGIPAGPEHFYISTDATIRYLKHRYPGALVYCQGTRSFVRQLTEAGIRTTEAVEPDVDVVLVAFDTELTHEKLRRTCELLTRGLTFLATNPDLVCPVSFGFVPDCGSVCQMLKNATGRTPVVIGKPEPTMIDCVREEYGISREETVVIGDRLYTDIASGINAGVTTICVLSGEATLADIAASDDKPDFVFESVSEIAEALGD